LIRSDKIEKFDIFKGNFPNPNPNHKWLTRPDPSYKKWTQLGSNNFDPDPSLCRKAHLNNAKKTAVLICTCPEKTAQRQGYLKR